VASLAIIFFFSLIATIKNVRPDLLSEKSSRSTDAIPDDPPYSLVDRYKKEVVEDIGEPMTACFLTGSNIDPTDW